MDVPAGTEPRVSAATWLGFAAMALGMVMAILDIQIVASSLAEIERSLGVAGGGISWIQTIYLIAEVVAIALTGWVGRALGLKGLFLVGIGGFTLASLACAASPSYPILLACRVAQGLCGGVLIPGVFAAVFLLFPRRLHERATMIAGVLAMLAPTVGPALGGVITEAASWHWLFLINLVPGALAFVVVARMAAPDAPVPGALRALDGRALLAVVGALALFEVTLELGPERGWGSDAALGLAGATVAAAVLAVRRNLRRDEPLVDLAVFADRSFALASATSLLLGIGLFGSVYLMPLFLGHVRGFGPLDIGAVMAVTGAAQLLMAPAATWLETRADARLLLGLGFALFAGGLMAGGFATVETGFDGMFWPQVARGAAMMLCLLPATRIALEPLPAHRVENASGLFNLMRNLGGAVGLALVDTVLAVRAPYHAEDLIARLEAGDATAATAIGLPPAMLAMAGAADESARAMVAPLVERAAATAAFNEAWWLLGVLVALGVAAAFALGPTGSPGRSGDRPRPGAV
jgi:DHA2 family multidrug resistance protein